MKLGDLLEVARHSMIELHDGMDGKRVTSVRENLKRYADVEVLSVYPKMKIDKDGEYCRPYLYVYGSFQDIQDIKSRREENPDE